MRDSRDGTYKLNKRPRDRKTLKKKKNTRVYNIKLVIKIINYFQNSNKPPSNLSIIVSRNTELSFHIHTHAHRESKEQSIIFKILENSPSNHPKIRS